MLTRPFKLLKRSVQFGKSFLYNRDFKVFCISMQRTGTTSVGRFFRDFGFRWAGWPQDKKNHWSLQWYEGNYEAIFSSLDFRIANAYEDSPWWLPGFYRILYHRFPRAKFILFTRDADAWFRSMVKHSNNNVVGSGKMHCKAYRRELEYFDLLQAGLLNEQTENQLNAEKKMKLTGLEEHYKDIYRLHTIEALDFFNTHAPDSLFYGQLEDPNKWQKLGAFLGVSVPPGYECHENASK